MNAYANLFRLDGKSAVVTGAGSGLGLAFARGLAGFGAEVVCADVHAARAEEAVAAIRAEGGRASAITVDVADAGSVEALGRELPEHCMSDVAVAAEHECSPRGGHRARHLAAHQAWFARRRLIGLKLSLTDESGRPPSRDFWPCRRWPWTAMMDRCKQRRSMIPSQ